MGLHGKAWSTPLLYSVSSFGRKCSDLQQRALMLPVSWTPSPAGDSCLLGVAGLSSYLQALGGNLLPGSGSGQGQPSVRWGWGPPLPVGSLPDTLLVRLSSNPV